MMFVNEIFKIKLELISYFLYIIILFYIYFPFLNINSIILGILKDPEITV